MTEFSYGQKVKLVLDSTKVGMIVGETNWGDIYTVRLAETLTTHNFESVELTPFDPEPGEANGEVVETEVVDLETYKTTKKAG